MDLLKVPVLNWGVSLSIPNFQQKEYQHNLHLAKIDEQIATLNYQNTVYNALEDVKNKFILWQAQRQNHQLLIQAEQLAKKQLDYQKKHYQLGLISRKEWEENQENYRQSQTAITDSVINQVQSVVALYQAVGARD